MRARGYPSLDPLGRVAMSSMLLRGRTVLLGVMSCILCAAQDRFAVDRRSGRYRRNVRLLDQGGNTPLPGAMMSDRAPGTLSEAA